MPQFGPKTTTDLQAIIAEIVKSWSCTDVYVPASGNFALERVLRAADRFRVHGGDSTLLAGATGSYLAGQPFRAVLQGSHREIFGWIEPFLEEQASAVAAVSLLYKMAPVFQRSNAYYRRLQAAHREQFPAMHAKLMQKLADQPLRLDSFYLGGVREMLRDIPPDAAVVTHSGTWKVDARVEELLISVLDWDRPDAQPIAKRTEMQEAIAQVVAREQWALISAHELPELESSLRGSTQTTNRGGLTYVYASHGAARIVRPHQKIEPILMPRLTPGQALGQQLTILPIAGAQFDALRATYLNASIRPSSSVPLGCAVLVDGVIIGGFAFSFEPTLCNWDNWIVGPQAYLLSDFAVGPTDYPRLSKLVVAAALSKEARLLAERKAGGIRRSLVTTAFAKRPNSMKYRGLLDLLIRKEADSEDIEGGKGYKLTYGGELGRWSLEEAYREWQAKHGERRESPTTETPTTAKS